MVERAAGGTAKLGGIPPPEEAQLEILRLYYEER